MVYFLIEINEEIIIKEIKEYLKQNKDITIEKLVLHLNKKNNIPKKDILKIIKKLEKSKELQLFQDRIKEERKEITSFFDYLLSIKALDFWISLLIIFIVLPLVLLVPDNSLTSGNGFYFFLGILRMIFGGIIVLFLPGFALISILYPNNRDIDNLQKYGLSFGLSIVIVVLIGLALNYTPFGITLTPILLSIDILTLIFTVIAIILKINIFFKSNN